VNNETLTPFSDEAEAPLAISAVTSPDGGG
jgi:hypothetical protein